MVMDGGFQMCIVNHSVFYRRIDSGCVILAVYVDDILLTVSDSTSIAETKKYLRTHFVTKDMSNPKYFLGFEFAYSKGRMFLSQRKYILDLLQETGLLGCKSESMPIEPSPPFWDSSLELLKDPEQYKRLIGKLIYLTVTRLNIAYAVNLLS